MGVHKEFRNVTNQDSSAPRKMWSPIYRALVLAVMFGMVFGGFMLLQPQAASAQSAAVVTDYLNLRTEPNTSASIITVMRPGTAISVTGAGQNGFLPVTHAGNSGWAHGDWIAVGGTAPSTNTGVTGTATVIDGALNLRSGPSTGNSIITVMPGGTTVSLTGEASGGFLGVVYNGTSGWAFGDYLRTGGSAPAPSQPSAPANPGVGDTVVGTMVTTASLNMRSGASTSNTIITTIPSGATVDIMGSASGSWYPVRYAGNKGWSHGDWLTTGADSTPAPAPAQPAPTPAPAPVNNAIGDTVVGTMYVSTGLNLRSGPDTSNSVLTIMPGGATVSVMGDPVSGWYPLTFAGTKGWAFGDYLQTTAPVLPTPPSDSAYTKDELIQIIYAAADKYGQPRADMLRVAQCESVLDPNVVNPASGASGLFQFMPSTFAFTPFAGQDIFDPVVNANAAGWMWDNGMRNHWVCQ